MPGLFPHIGTFRAGGVGATAEIFYAERWPFPSGLAV
jgi:hypothetical protein